MRVAVLEDEAALRDLIIVPGLRRYGFDARGYESIRQFQDDVVAFAPRLLILDVGLPDGDGYSVARQLRETHPGLGIIMLTSRAAVDDKVRGLSEGADSFFSKPIEIDLLAAALHSLVRRLVNAPQVLPAARWSLTPDGWGLTGPNGAAVALSGSERRLCDTLFAQADNLVPREELALAVAGRSEDFDAHRLDAMIHRLRAKVRKRCGLELPLASVHGRGYILSLGRTSGD
ncbi:response regulator transcription factor [Stenotrophomonas sp. PFBMAA-4]|uniref:response regulator transcription factor n=1 Tax=Stenotrophomonas sp. PFBMAA-4 TaxID=3043301 RepID=UPI0024B5203C|nr:response regulator transcription factor [Stenotrophomonas sp. PFBMAA-4]MDI9272438.1 response regulator transcription factor [Stenotrophomonas sp. PFBMAA-4]